MYILFKCFNLYFGGEFPKKQTRKEKSLELY